MALDWDGLSTVTFATEKDVELRLLLPLLAELGWKREEIHGGVPVHFKLGSKRTGRKPEADLVLAPASDASPNVGWVVVEAKKPGGDLGDGGAQAWSYSLALKAPLYVVSNGKQLQIWEVRWGKDHRLALDISQSDLVENRLNIHQLIGRSAVETRITDLNGLTGQLPGQILDQYLRALIPTLSEDLVERKLAIGPAGPSLKWPPELSDSSRYYLQGNGGRGKTSLLHQLVRNPGNDRLPIYVRVRPWEMDGLLALVCSAIAAHVPGVKVGDINQILKKHRCVICIDDWHKACPQFVDLARDEIAGVLNSTPLVIASRGAPAALATLNFLGLQVPMFTKEEQNGYIDQSLGSGEAWGFWQKIPQSLRAVLKEPIFLSAAVQIVDRDRSARFNDIDVLLQKFFQLALGADDAHGERAGLLAGTCELLALNDSPYEMSTVMSILHTMSQGAEQDILSRLVHSGILVSPKLGMYEFSHEVWQDFFRCRKESRDLGAPHGVSDWVGAQGAFLSERAPLMASMIAEPSAQAALLRELLHSDLEAYFSALCTRASTVPYVNSAERERFELSQILEGMEDLVLTALPKVKEWFDPWRDDPDAQAAISGTINEHALSFGFCAEGSLPSRVDLTGVATTTGINLKGSKLRRDSGRLVATRDILRTLSRRFERDKLPRVPWVAREAFALMARDLSELLEDDRPTASSVLDWAASVVEEMKSEVEDDQQDAAFAVEAGWGKIYLLDDIVDAAQAVKEFGFGSFSIAELLLPGPDKALGAGGPFHIFYSDDRKRKRMTALFDAVASTYRDVCENYLAPLSQVFQYGAGPVRPCVSLMNEGFLETWWEPVATWEEAKTQLVDIDPRVANEEWPERFEKVLQMHQRAGRSTAYVSWRAGRIVNWAPYEATVTKLVGQMLKSDVDRLIRLLSRAS